MGNHEFDRGVAEAVSYMENLNAPIVVANIDDSAEPTFQGKYQKSITIDKYGRRIGVIGTVVRTVNVSITLNNRIQSLTIHTFCMSRFHVLSFVLLYQFFWCL